jgi:hypothetical protein
LGGGRPRPIEFACNAQSPLLVQDQANVAGLAASKEAMGHSMSVNFNKEQASVSKRSLALIQTKLRL